MEIEVEILQKSLLFAPQINRSVIAQQDMAFWVEALFCPYTSKQLYQLVLTLAGEESSTFSFSLRCLRTAKRYLGPSSVFAL